MTPVSKRSSAQLQPPGLMTDPGLDSAPPPFVDASRCPTCGAKQPSYRLDGVTYCGSACGEAAPRGGGRRERPRHRR
jgi:hypothetical protein